MNIVTYVKNSTLKILYFICLLSTINLVLLSSKPLDAQLTDILYMDFLIVFISIIFTVIDYRRWLYSYNKISKAVILNDKIDESIPSNNYYYEVTLIKNIVRLKNIEMERKVQEVKVALFEMNDYITKWVHEIKIPLSVCELVVDKIEELDLSEQLILEFNRIKFLIDQVLYTSRASSYSEDLQVSEINIQSIVKEVIKRNSVFFISKNINLKLDKNINHDVITDEKWLSYIIDQLLNNACKYVPCNGEITIYARDEENAVKLYVEDNGIGIKKKDINRIFDRGFTGENGRNSTKSTGMGLYLSKKMAHKLNHDIYVESEEGKGTRFTICFYKLSDYFRHMP